MMRNLGERVGRIAAVRTEVGAVVVAFGRSHLAVVDSCLCSE